MSERIHMSDDRNGSNSDGKTERGLGRPLRPLLIFLGMLVGLFDEVLGGWGEPIAMAGAAVLVPIFALQFRRFRIQTRFWITLSLLTAVQVPLVVWVRSLIQKYGHFYSLGFGIVDVMFVGAVILLVCSTWKGGRV